MHSSRRNHPSLAASCHLTLTPPLECVVKLDIMNTLYTWRRNTRSMRIIYGYKLKTRTNTKTHSITCGVSGLLQYVAPLAADRPLILYIPQAENNLTRYGRLLLSSIPEDTTHLLVDICTGSGFALPVPPPERVAPPERPNTVGSFIPYLNRASLIISSDAASGKSTIKDTTTLPGQPSNSFEPGHATKSSISKTSSPHTGSRASSPPPPLASKPRPLVRRPSPRLYFAHFIEHPQHFLRFLEAVALARWGQKVDVLGSHELRPTVTEPPADEDVDRADQIAIWNTLIELYLTLSSNYMSHDPPNPQGAKVMEDKALNVLKSPFAFDTTHALLVCSTRGFTEGLVLLWEKLGMYEDVLRFWMDKENNSPADESVDIDPHTRASAHVLYYLEKYGPQHPYLYPLVLRFLTSTPTLLQRHTHDLSRILEHIEQEKIMPPLLVVQILSRNNVASVGLVKQWLMRRISETRDEIDAVCRGSSPRSVVLTCFAGPSIDQLLSRRDSDQNQGDRRAQRPKQLKSVPCHSLFGMWGSPRTTDYPLYVQAQLPPEVC